MARERRVGELCVEHSDFKVIYREAVVTGKIDFRLMVSVFLFTTLLATGCAGTSTLYSNTFVKPAQTVTDIKILYLENKLVGKRGGSVSLAAIGYNDLPELLKERAPVVFNLNGISADYATIQKADFGQKEALNTVRWSKTGNANSPLLVIQIVDGSAMTYQGSTTYYLNMHANLFDSSTQTRQWTGQFRNTLSKALLGRIGFDNDFVDKMLKSVLEQMAKDGIVKLHGEKAIIPAPKQLDNEQPRT